jgi:hypothetical protein
MIMTRSKFAGVLAVALALVFATPALAVDGEILINQAKANAGGITPGDAPGYPVTLSRPGQYKLSGNLTVPEGFSGLNVTANDVTLDLNGFTIQGDNASYGVIGVSVVRLRVMNGTITGFTNSNGGFGIDADGEGGLVENMRFVGNTVAMEMNKSRIRNNTLANNKFGFNSCSKCLIENNIVAGALTNTAIFADHSVLLGNLIVGNAGYGLFGNGNGYGNNILIGNHGGGAQTGGTGNIQLHPNACDPACP